MTQGVRRGGATEIDRQIAKNLRRFRSEAGLTQPAVAAHLGVSYQSYQKMEGGKVSFRASTLDRIGTLYNLRLHQIVAGSETELDPLMIKALWLMHGMSGEDRDTCIRAILAVKHRNKP